MDLSIFFLATNITTHKAFSFFSIFERLLTKVAFALVTSTPAAGRRGWRYPPFCCFTIVCLTSDPCAPVVKEISTRSKQVYRTPCPVRVQGPTYSLDSFSLTDRTVLKHAGHGLWDCRCSWVWVCMRCVAVWVGMSSNMSLFGSKARDSGFCAPTTLSPLHVC